jgi:Concanavalin A-like lectin/glucanases superfamily
MSTVYAAQLGPNAYLKTLPSQAFDFGAGDFTVAASIMGSKPGVLVSQKGTTGGGFILAVGAGGQVTLATYDPQTSVAGATVSTRILDGGCHSVTAIRRGSAISILIDGEAVTTTIGGPGRGPLNVSSGQALTIGHTADTSYPLGNWPGMIMNVGAWGAALDSEAIVRAQFARVAATDPGLAGYWTLDATGDDLSGNDNPASIVGPVMYMACIACVWASGDNQYAFGQMGNTPTSEQAAQLADEAAISMSRELAVPAGAPALFGAIMAAGDTPAFPSGAIVSITDPSGATYTQDLNTEAAFVRIVDGQPWVLALRAPMPGTWRMTVTAPAATGFVMRLNTVPSAEVVSTITTALEPIYGPGTFARELSAEGLMGWYEVFLTVAIGAAVGALAVAVVVVTGGTAAPAVIYAGCALAGISAFSFDMALGVLSTSSKAQATNEIGGMAGFVESKGTVLLVDQNADTETGYFYSRRQRRVYAAVTASKFNKKQQSLAGSDDTRTKLVAGLAGFGNGYVSIVGHGLPSYITGWFVSGTSGPYQEVLTVGKYQPVEASGKIIHHAGCSAGATLGPDLVAHGAVAFFGYKDKFLLDVPERLVFIDCDGSIDSTLIAGKTCADAQTAALEAYNTGISRLRANGNYTAAAALEKDRDRLVGPLTSVAYGDKTATLS